MTTLVVGAGAIGQLVAGRLAAAGQPVVLLARSNAALLQSTGIRITVNDQTLTVKPKIVTAAQLPTTAVELAIVAVKGYDTLGAAELLAQLQPHTVLSLQNGLGNEELLAAALPASHIIAGTITTPVEFISPTHIQVAKERGVGLAAMQQVQQSQAYAMGQLSQLISLCVPNVRVYASWRAMKWSKLLLNMLGNGLPALLDWEPAQVYADPRLVQLERTSFLEAWGTMHSLGLRPVNLPGNLVRPLVALLRWLPLSLLQPVLQHLLISGRGGKLPSLLLELRRHSPQNEANRLYGAVAQAATAVGHDAPVNRALAQLLNDISSGACAWDELRGQPERVLRLLGA